MGKKETQNKMDLPLVGGVFRFLLRSGAVRAGTVSQDWEDAVLITDPKGQIGVIYKSVIAEIWEGLGAKPEEKKTEDDA